MKMRGMSLVLTVASTALLGCGGDPPTADMNAAKQALDAARAAGNRRISVNATTDSGGLRLMPRCADPGVDMEAASMKRISPPWAVTASPTATPGIRVRSAISGRWGGAPRESETNAGSM